MKKIYLLSATFLVFCTWLTAQNTQVIAGHPVYAKAGIKKTINDLLAASAGTLPHTVKPGSSRPLRSYLGRYKSLMRQDKASRNIPSLQAANKTIKPSFETKQLIGAVTPGNAQQVWSNFLSIDFYENPIGWPPDPNGAVSEDQVIVATNNGIKIHDKKGVTDPPATTPRGFSKTLADGIFIPLDNFFSAVIPRGSDISDPHIRYDRLSKRWFAVAIEINPSEENNEIFVAVSDVGKLTGTSGFTFYSFNSSLFPYDPDAPYAPFLDYPQLGVDKNSVLIGGNQFGYDSLTNVGYVIDKIKLLQGELVIYPFELGVFNFIDGTAGGMYTPQGVTNDDPIINKSFFAGITYFNDGLVVAKIGYNKKHIPELTSETTIPVPEYNFAREISSPGGLTDIDPNDGRLLEASIHKNKITGVNSLWTAHAIGVDQDGDDIVTSDSDYVKKARTAARWYQLNSIYTTPVLNQYGTVYDADQPSGRRAKQYFNPSIVMSGQGHSVIGGTSTAFDDYLDVFVAGRYHGEPKGSMHSPQKATNTTAIYAPYIYSQGSHIYIGRWGDFSQTVVDPLDDQTIWTFQEYADVDDSYGVRAVQVKAPPPATPLALGDLSNATDTTVTLNGMSQENSGFFDPGDDLSGPGFNRLRVTSTGSVGVSSIKFLSPTRIRFKLSTKNQAPGEYFLVITNPDGQAVAASYTISASRGSRMSGTIATAENLAGDKIAGKYIVTSGIFPNPVKNEVTLQVNAVNDFTGKVVLMSINGKKIFERSYDFARGKGEAVLPVSGLNGGTYIAAVYNKENRLITVHTIVKQ